MAAAHGVHVATERDDFVSIRHRPLVDHNKHREQARERVSLAEWLVHALEVVVHDVELRHGLLAAVGASCAAYATPSVSGAPMRSVRHTTVRYSTAQCSIPRLWTYATTMSRRVSFDPVDAAVA